MWRLAVIAAFATGCDARLGAAVSDGSVADAAGPIDSLHDGRGDAAASSCATGRVVYLNFEGQALTRATASDATANQAAWMGVASATLPKFRPGAADRVTQLQAIVAQVTQQLAIVPSIHVVTQRPAAGPYVMIGFGGSQATVSVPYLYAVNHLDCGDAVKSDVGWIFEAVPTTQMAANLAVGAIAFGLGVTGTTNTSDCMCGWLTSCTAAATVCTFSTSITAQLNCPNETNPQNEVATLDTFCQ